MTYEEFEDACFEFIKNKEDLDEQEKHFALAPLHIDRDDLSLHGSFIFKRLELMGYEVVKKPEPLDFEEMRKVFGPCESEGEKLAKELGLYKDPVPVFWITNPSFETLLRRRNQP